MKKFFLKTTLSVCSVALLLGMTSYSWADSSVKCQGQACQNKACVTCPQDKDGKCCKAKKKCGPRRHGKKCCKISNRIAKELQLTEEQRTKAAPSLQKFDSAMLKVQQSKRGNFEKVLTSEQREQLQQYEQKTLGPEDGFHEGRQDRMARPYRAERPTPIKLSQEQKDTLAKYRQQEQQDREKALATLKADLRPILTAEQQNKLEAFKMKDCAGAPKCGPKGGHKGGPRGGHHGMKPGPGPEHFMGELPPFVMEQLQLSEAQDKQIKDICEKYRQSRQKRFEDMRKADKSEAELMQKEISSVLTAEQRAKLTELEKQRPQRQDRPCRESCQEK